MTDIIAEWSKDPQFIAEYERMQARYETATRLTGWMRRIPVLGYFVHTFWWMVIAEGVRDTLTPRWEASRSASSTMVREPPCGTPGVPWSIHKASSAAST